MLRLEVRLLMAVEGICQIGHRSPLQQNHFVEQTSDTTPGPEAPASGTADYDMVYRVMAGRLTTSGISPLDIRPRCGCVGGYQRESIAGPSVDRAGAMAHGCVGFIARFESAAAMLRCNQFDQFLDCSTGLAKTSAATGDTNRWQNL